MHRERDLVPAPSRLILWPGAPMLITGVWGRACHSRYGDSGNTDQEGPSVGSKELEPSPQESGILQAKGRKGECFQTEGSACVQWKNGEAL